jgi:hypothetical protein
VVLTRLHGAADTNTARILYSTVCGPPSSLCVNVFFGRLLRGRIWSVYSLALAYQANSAVWSLADRLPSRLLQNTTARLRCQLQGSIHAMDAGDLLLCWLRVCGPSLKKNKPLVEAVLLVPLFYFYVVIWYLVCSYGQHRQYRHRGRSNARWQLRRGTKSAPAQRQALGCPSVAVGRIKPPAHPMDISKTHERHVCRILGADMLAGQSCFHPPAPQALLSTKAAPEQKRGPLRGQETRKEHTCRVSAKDMAAGRSYFRKSGPERVTSQRPLLPQLLERRKAQSGNNEVMCFTIACSLCMLPSIVISTSPRPGRSQVLVMKDST